jgi:hypothetical protein
MISPNRKFCIKNSVLIHMKVNPLARAWLPGSGGSDCLEPDAEHMRCVAAEPLS